MENSEYNRLIYSNKLDELVKVSIFNIDDLTRYKYLNKYLLEYLLEKDIHTKRMDLYARSNSLWISIYLKYNIIIPLIKSQLKELLKKDNNELLLDKLLKVLDNNQKMELYKNIKKDDYWFFIANESLIIDSYSKYGIKLSRLFLPLPLISDNTVKTNKNIETVLDKFIDIYSDTDKITLCSCLNELKSNYKVNKNSVISDIEKLIKYKEKNPKFKLNSFDVSDDVDHQGGKYSYNNELTIDKYRKGVFTHELSHMLYSEFEDNDEFSIIKKYTIIQKNINDDIIGIIIKYLEDFHDRYNYMINIFVELYYKEIEKRYGNYINYQEIICQDIINCNMEFVTIDQNGATIYLSDDNIKESAKELIRSKAYEYAKVLTNNYYTEELFLENLLDSLLNGDILEGNCQVKSLSGHTKEYFNNSPDTSFDECLANYYAIRNSNKSKRIINDLKNIVGKDLIYILEKYLNQYRNSKLIKK